jgi:hypothetical protein
MAVPPGFTEETWQVAERFAELVGWYLDQGAYSGDCDRRFQPKVITDSGDRDHAVTRPTGSA